MPYKKIHVVAWMIINAGLIILVSELAAGSPNPVEAFNGHGALPKLMLGLLILILAAPIRAVFILINARKAICAKVIPVRCGELVLEPKRSHKVNTFMFPATTSLNQSVPRPKRDLEGIPVRCKVCRKWYHRSCLTFMLLAA